VSLLRIAPVVLITALGVGSAAVFYAARPAQPAPSLSGETRAEILTAPFGGTVEKIMVSAGVRVVKGQHLLRLHAGELQDRSDRVISAFEKTPLETLDRGSALISRVPAQTWMRARSADPERLAAEQEYVSALAAAEQSPTEATRQRLVRASKRRIELEAKVIHPDLFATLARRQHETADDVAWLRHQFDKGDVKAPVAGRVAIFDLHVGDRVAPNGRLMLIEVAE
jgi:biotin carboxyl carrier protein